MEPSQQLQQTSFASAYLKVFHVSCSIKKIHYRLHYYNFHIKIKKNASLIIYKYILSSEGYLRKIPVERRGKYPEPLQRRGTFDCPGNRYFSQITLTNRIYLFNSAEYLTANKTVPCKQVQNFRPPRSFDFQLRRDVINYLKKGFRLERDIFLQYRDIFRQISRQWWKS